MTDNQYALTHLYHPSGAKVDIPIDLASGISPERASNIMISVDALLSAGFTVNMPGLDDGELVDEVTAVARRAHTDGTPIVAFYKAHPKVVKKFIHEYLDTPEQRGDFEAATGLKLANLPEWEGDKDITKDHPKAGKYIVQLPRPLKVVYRVTDRWNQWNAAGGNGQQPQKFELLRYMTNGNGHSQPAPAVTPLAQAPMTYEQAQAVKTPGGAELRTLDAEKLNLLANSHAPNVTDEMRKAANTILTEMQMQGA